MLQKIIDKIRNIINLDTPQPNDAELKKIEIINEIEELLSNRPEYTYIKIDKYAITLDAYLQLIEKIFPDILVYKDLKNIYVYIDNITLIIDLASYDFEYKTGIAIKLFNKLYILTDNNESNIKSISLIRFEGLIYAIISTDKQVTLLTNFMEVPKTFPIKSDLYDRLLEVRLQAEDEVVYIITTGYKNRKRIINYHTIDNFSIVKTVTIDEFGNIITKLQ